MPSPFPSRPVRPGALGLAAALLCAGCASLAPPRDVPPPPVPERYAEAPDPAPSAPALDWRSFSRDAALNALVAQALAHNRELRAAVLRVEQARAAWGIQRADRLPTVGVALQGARSRVPADLNLTRQPLLGDQLQVGVGFSSWEVDLWGRVRNLQDAALQNWLASEANSQAVALSLVAQVAQGWLAWRELDERLALAQRSAASRAESLRIVRRRVEVGSSARLELTQVELLWRQAQALVAQLEQARAAQAHALALLAGSPIVLAPGTAPASLAEAAPFAEVAAGLPAELLQRRPDVAAAEHALQGAGASIGAARAAFFPRIALTAQAGSASAELDGLLASGSGAWSLGLDAGLALLDSGRRRAAVQAAELRRDEAAARYEQAVQAAFRDVSDALSARRWWAEQAAILDATLDVQTERARLARLRFDAGAASHLEVLDAERDLLSLQQQRVQAHRARLSAQLALWSALGGGALADSPSPAVDAASAVRSAP